MIIVPSNVGSPIPSDPSWANVSLLVKDIGINGATNNSFYDDGPYKFLPTRNGDVTQGSFSPFGPLSGDAPPQLGGSVYFDGSGDYLTATGTTINNFGTGDFTIEMWVYFNSINSIQFLYDGRPNTDAGAYLGLYFNSGTVNFFSNNADVIISSSLSAGVWYHVAVSRVSGSTRLFINGIQSGSTYSDSTNYASTFGNYIGTRYNNTFSLNGNISNLRVVKGTGLYTAAFKPPTAPLTAISGTSLLTCQSATAITDASSNAFTVSKFGDARAVVDSPFGWGSVYFDGSGDYLSIPSSTAVAYGTGDFTVEFWAYPTSSSGSLFVSGYNGTAVAGVNVGITNSTSLWWLFGNGSGWDFERRPTYTLPMNTWHHFAVTRESGTAKLYVDGVLVDSVANTTNFGSSAWYVGASASAGYNITGNVSNLRVVKGSAVYTGSSFAVPTAPLTAISGTSLLTCQDKGSIVDASTNSFTVTRVGDAKPVGMTPFAQKQAGYWSASFPDNSSYLSLTSPGSMEALGTSDYTLEIWVNFTNAYDANRNIYLTQSAATGLTNALTLQIYQNTLYFYYNGSSSTLQAANINFVPGNWYHIAVVRSSMNLTMYINGQPVATSSTQDTNNIGALTSFSTCRSYGSRTEPFIASNLRLVKGTAVYSSAFTPPSSPLTEIRGTVLFALRDARFRDSGNRNLAITVNGTSSVSRFNPFGATLPAPTVNLASAGSVYFDGSGDYLSIPHDASFNLPGDFTVEFWINPAAGMPEYAGIIGHRRGFTFVDGVDWVIRAQPGAGKIGWGSQVSGGYIDMGPMTYGAWSHYAVTRSGTTMRTFCNGALITTVTDSATYSANANVVLGDNPDNSLFFKGYISNARIVKGTAVYTGNFTPPTSPLTAISGTSLLTAQDAVTVTDASSNNFTVTKVGDAKAVDGSPFKRVTYPYGGSAYFDGSSDYLSITGNSKLDFGTGDFTVDGWFYLEGTGYLHTLFDIGGISGGAGILLRKQYLQVGGSTYNIDDSVMPRRAWFHAAVARSSGTVRFFVNGVQITSFANSSSLTSATTYIGTSVHAPTSEGWQGYISNVRAVKGVALYTANFVPDVSPVSAVGGTSLLLNFDNAGIYDASGNSNLAVVGTPKVSTSVAKYGNGSLTFDGTAVSYLYPVNTKDFAFGSGDFTIEGWVYYPSDGGYFFLYSGVSGGNVSGTIYISGNSGTGSLRYIKNSPYSNNSIGTVTGGNWYHVAISRSSGVTRMFLNGVKGATDLSDTDTYTDAAQRPLIGNYGADISYSISGSIEDLRITRGVGRYTSNFTPPALEAATRKG